MAHPKRLSPRFSLTALQCIQREGHKFFKQTCDSDKTARQYLEMRLGITLQNNRQTVQRDKRARWHLASLLTTDLGKHIHQSLQFSTLYFVGQWSCRRREVVPLDQSYTAVHPDLSTPS